MKRLVTLALVVCAQMFAQNAALMPVPKLQFFDNSGYPLSGGLLYTCAAGTSCAPSFAGDPPLNPLASYTDSTAGTANANPIVLDGSGRAAVWLGSGNYKVVLQDSTGAAVWTQDNVSSTSMKSITATSGNAANFTFTASGTGAVSRTVAAKLGESISVKDFGAKGDGVTNDTAALQAALNSGGRITIPKGTYLFNAALAVTVDGTQLIGDGTAMAFSSMPNVTLRYTGGSGNALSVTGYGVLLKGFWLDNTGTGTTGIRVSSSYDVLKDITVQPQTPFTSEGIALDNAGVRQRITIEDVFTQNTTVGLRANHCNAVDVNRFHSVDNSVAGIMIGDQSGCYSMRIRAGVFDTTSNAYPNAVFIQAVIAESLTIADGYFESAGSNQTNILTAPVFDTNVNDLVITGNRFQGNSITPYAIQLTNHLTSGVFIAGNLFRAFTTGGINAAFASSCVSTANLATSTPGIVTSGTCSGQLDGPTTIQGNVKFSHVPNATYAMTLDGSPTANRTYTMPDSSGYPQVQVAVPGPSAIGTSCTMGTFATSGFYRYECSGAVGSTTGAWVAYPVFQGMSNNHNWAMPNVDGTLGLKVGAPAASTDACTVGSWASGSSFAYFCIATNSWIRVAKDATAW